MNEALTTIDAPGDQHESEQAHADRTRPFCMAARATIQEARKGGAIIGALRIHPYDAKSLERNGERVDRLWGYHLWRNSRVPVGQVQPVPIPRGTNIPDEITVQLQSDEGEAPVKITFRGFAAHVETLKKVQAICTLLAEQSRPNQ